MQRSRLVRIAAIAGFLVLAPSILDAHVTVAPRESQAGAEQRYTVRVPTEGQVTTTSLELEVPPDMTIIEVVPGEGYTFETRREGARIVAITWKRDIPPRQSADFAFIARNPKSQQIAWKAHQRFADGTSADWIGVEGDRRPAAVTKLVAR
jgi:uncharacterized protein YcnI